VVAALLVAVALALPSSHIVDWFERCRDAYTADARTSGGLSDNLALSFAYRQRATAQNDQFAISLENRSNDTLKLCVESRQFHGRIVVASHGGVRHEYLDCATLDEAAIVPPFGGFRSDNAKQISRRTFMSIRQAQSHP